MILATSHTRKKKCTPSMNIKSDTVKSVKVLTWVTGATDANPRGSGNMVQVGATEYGSGGGTGCASCTGARDKARVAVQYVDASKSVLPNTVTTGGDDKPIPSWKKTQRGMPPILSVPTTI